MVKQSSLGQSVNSRYPSFNKTDMGRVTANDRYDSQGIIEVVLLDYSKPFPVWVVGDIDRKPVTGDMVIIAYVSGRKDSPYLVGFVKNKSYTTNFIMVDKDKIRIQLPCQEVGKKNGKAHNDIKSHLRDNSKLSQRAYIELTASGINLHHPTGKVLVNGKEVATK